MVLALFFIHSDGPNGSRGTDMSTGNAVVLTTAGADPEVQHRRPEAFQAALDMGRVNNVGGTNPHALSTFDAPF